MSTFRKVADPFRLAATNRLLLQWDARSVWPRNRRRRSTATEISILRRVDTGRRANRTRFEPGLTRSSDRSNEELRGFKEG